MKALIRLFKAVEVRSKKRKSSSKELLAKTIRRGFIFSSEVVYNYSEKELDKIIKVIEEEVGLTPEKMNSTFHKSWDKVKNAPMIQLVMEQILHYITTYGFEFLGIYNVNSVYIPHEELKIPELKKGINLVVVHGYTKKEIKEKTISLLKSGIALKEETMADLIDILDYVGIDEKEVNLIRNKEVKIKLYDYFDIIPKNPIELLRYAIYKSVSKTLLIKSPGLINEIKSKDNRCVYVLFHKYRGRYGFEKLAEIFFRFKPLFLAFRTNLKMKMFTNEIRKLANTYHKPMEEDYLNNITAKIKKGIRISETRLNSELGKVNTFRKIRLAYALKFRTQDADSILYRIRNGKGYATEFKFKKKAVVVRILNIVLDSIISDVEKSVKGKKIYIPDNIHYTLPATEKQFTGDVPSGSCVVVPRDMVFGVHWENLPNCRVDIDLSLISVNEKIGWDRSYRRGDGCILFSGDVTDAPKPNGATELFYVRRQKTDDYIMFANNYTYLNGINTDIPFKIIVGSEQVSNLRQNYMVNPNNVKAVIKTKIANKQKILGLISTTVNNCKFYFAESDVGNSITSRDNVYTEYSRKYLVNFYKHSISLKYILSSAGCKLVTDKKKCDIDLSLESLEKDKIIKLLTK